MCSKCIHTYTCTPFYIVFGREAILSIQLCEKNNDDNTAKMPDSDNTVAVPDSDMKGVPDDDSTAAKPDSDSSAEMPNSENTSATVSQRLEHLKKKKSLFPLAHPGT